LIVLFIFFVEKPDLPFFIKRSKYNNLPVYTDYKNARSRKITIIRKIKGDLKVRLLQPPPSPPVMEIM